MAVLTELKMRLNLNCPLVLVPGYLVLNWMETEDPTTDTTGSDGSEGEPEGNGVHACTERVRDVFTDGMHCMRIYHAGLTC